MSWRTQYLNRIRHLLAGYAGEIRLDGKVNRLSEHISAEDICCGLMNLIYDYSLENVNHGKANHAAIDLADPRRGIAVQVTARNERRKVLDTLQGFRAQRGGQRLSDTYGTLIVLILTVEEKFSGHKLLLSETPGLQILTLADLSAAVDALSLEKVRRIRDYLEAQLGAGSPEPLPVHRLPAPPRRSGCFVSGSRDAELTALHEAMRDGDPVYLWGVGGIGKTQTAIEFARCYAPARGAYFLRYTLPPDGVGEAMQETILQADFSDYRSAGMDRESDYRARLHILRTEYAGALLIIDNFDWPGRSLHRLQSEASFRELTQTGVQLLFTTRCVAEERGVEVGSISSEHLLMLMRGILKDTPAGDRELLDLIHAVDGHTLMAELMARTLRRSHGSLTPALLLEKFRQNSLDRSDLPAVGSERMQLASHLRVLFDLSGMSPWERKVLRWAALLPDEGMDYGLFQACIRFLPERSRGIVGRLFPERKRPPLPAEVLQGLVDCGWLSCQQELLTIHPVVRGVCWEELRPTDQNCGDFLFGLAEYFSPNKEYNAARFLQLARTFSLASDRLPDPNGYWATFAARLWSALGQTRTALLYDLRMVDRVETSGDDASRAAAHNFLGSTYLSDGSYGKALEHLMKGLELRKEALAPDHGDIAISLGNVGLCCMFLGKPAEALAYLQQALEIMERRGLQDALELALLYHNIGSVYVNTDEPEKAIEYERRAIETISRLEAVDQNAVAFICYNVGVSCRRMGEYEKALEFLHKALTIRQKNLPPDHPQMADIHGGLGSVYEDLGDREKALLHARKALEIRLTALHPEHPDLAVSYNNVGSIFLDMGQYAQALEYKRKALEITEKMLPPDYPRLAVMYDNVGHSYARMEDHRQALAYWEKSLAIREKHLGPGHPDTQKTRNCIAAAKARMTEQSSEAT